MSVDKLKMYKTIGELPTSYMISLTYEEQLIEINKKLNEIINVLNVISLEAMQELIDNAINELKTYVDSQDKLIYNYTDEEIKKLKKYVDNQNDITINTLTNLINQKVKFLTDYINSNVELLNIQIEQKFEELKEEIDKIIIEGIDVYNPTTGRYDNIQNVVYDLYKYLRYYGITASQFDTLNLTAKEFDDKEITARNFDLYSKNILMIDFNHYMYNPFTGKIDKITDVINQLANLHKPLPITANEFDLLELTASNFDNKELTAYEFDFNAGHLLTA